MQARIGAGRGRGCQLAFMAAKVEGEVERVQEVGGKGRGSGSLLMNLAAKRAEVEEEYVEKVKDVSENQFGLLSKHSLSSPKQPSS